MTTLSILVGVCIWIFKFYKLLEALMSSLEFLKITGGIHGGGTTFGCLTVQGFF